MKHPLLGGDKQLAETLMTLTGTTVIHVDYGDQTQMQTFAADADSDGMITALFDGGTIKIHHCADDPCLNLVACGDTANVRGLKPGGESETPYACRGWVIGVGGCRQKTKGNGD